DREGVDLGQRDVEERPEAALGGGDDLTSQGLPAAVEAGLAGGVELAGVEVDGDAGRAVEADRVLDGGDRDRHLAVDGGRHGHRGRRVQAFGSRDAGVDGQVLRPLQPARYHQRVVAALELR